MSMYVPVILGTARHGSKSSKVADFVLESAKEYGFETKLIKTSDYTIYYTGEEYEGLEKYREEMKKADGMIVVAPEYNHGYPGELKLLLDSTLEEYANKPMGICGVSSGKIGGARMAEQLKSVAIGMNMIPIRNTVYFSQIDDMQKYSKSLSSVFDQIKQYSKIS